MSRLLLLFLVAVMFLESPARGQAPIVDAVNGGFSPPFLFFAPDNVGWVYEPTFDYELAGIFSTFRPIFNPPVATRDVTLSLYDAPPSSGGTLLRSGVFSAGAEGGNLGVDFTPIDLTAGEDYFIGYDSIAGLGLNIVDFGVSLPPPDFQQNPDVQFLNGWYTGTNFSTFNSLAASPGFAAPILRFAGVGELPKPEPEPPSAQALTVADGNASITVDPLPGSGLGSSRGGLSNWSTDGTNNLYEQSWYLRVGDATQESPLDTLPRTLAEVIGTNQIHLVYSGSGLQVDLLYTLTGGAEGSGMSTIEETVTLTNLDTLDPLQLALFEYDDIDIPSFDTNTAAGGVGGITQQVADTMVTVTPQSPDAFQIGQAEPVQELRISLQDSGITNLSNGTSPFGPTDTDFAFQWNLNIPAGGSMSISTIKSTIGTAIPEPGTVMLIVMGILGLLGANQGRTREDFG